MKINLKYYVIHNLEKDRYENTLNLLKKYGVDLDDVTFVSHPNKNELTYQIKKKAVQKKSNIKDGWISCSYKHYLALEQIIKNIDDNRKLETKNNNLSVTYYLIQNLKSDDVRFDYKHLF